MDPYHLTETLHIEKNLQGIWLYNMYLLLFFLETTMLYTNRTHKLGLTWKTEKENKIQRTLLIIEIKQFKTNGYFAQPSSKSTYMAKQLMNHRVAGSNPAVGEIIFSSQALLCLKHCWKGCKPPHPHLIICCNSHMKECMCKPVTNEPHHEKTCLLGFRPGKLKPACWATETS